ncbi:hypothetical protein R1flu_000506 [Riccia fluitans]|uniref:Trichome birefringence-like C-terminal domain-containing protein n=1 Tax=Riccia fluitans TaxID=41844 RepID=A0ABD1Y0M8_9MARC
MEGPATNIRNIDSSLLAALFHGLIRLEYYRSTNLVQQSRASSYSSVRVKSTFKLDWIDYFARKWRDADIFIFNSGHWWKTIETGNYFQVKDEIRMEMKVEGVGHGRRKVPVWIRNLQTSPVIKSHERAREKNIVTMQDDLKKFVRIEELMQSILCYQRSYFLSGESNLSCEALGSSFPGVGRLGAHIALIAYISTLKQ